MPSMCQKFVVNTLGTDQISGQTRYYYHAYASTCRVGMPTWNSESFNLVAIRLKVIALDATPTPYFLLTMNNVNYILNTLICNVEAVQETPHSWS